ncbi:hypothetical protein ACTVZO_39285 [Streptomyces sp. IBSNAI002]|uniref:hypothetical protein n=1 Tax=Streptomyces sp. IBSNAI002 TaxID=3457500 RepID=UPI003FD4B477
MDAQTIDVEVVTRQQLISICGFGVPAPTAGDVAVGRRRRRGRGEPHRPVTGRQEEGGSGHHLICGERGTQLKAITTAAGVNDVTHTFALVDDIPLVADRPG